MSDRLTFTRNNCGVICCSSLVLFCDFVCDIWCGS